MKQLENREVNRGVRRRRRTAKRNFLLKIVLNTVLLVAIACVPHFSLVFSQDYSRLIELIRLEDKENPLYVFNDFENEFDEGSHKGNLEYFNDHPDLIRRIKDDLDGGEIRWRLDTLMQRLLFVPEIREEYATTFEDYCNDVISYVLDKTNINNPYMKIQTLHHERPETSDSGVMVFLVHNLAKEFVARYIFSNKKRYKKVRIALKGIVFIGEVGSFTTTVYLRNNGRLKFIRDNYTIWQNSAKNPYTALTVPVEETLHIALREHTERAIKEQLELNPVKSTEEVENIVEDLIALEEGIVGGLVHALLPYFVKRYVPGLAYSLIEEDIESKSGMKQYRHLKKGIEFVENMGYRKTLEMYSNDPIEFKKLLM